MTINDLLIEGRKYLIDTQIEDIPLKVRLLVEHICNMNKFELVINHDQPVTDQQINDFEIGLEKIKNNVPIQYITNHQEFMKLNFYVDENVLIPQPDTEVLVEEVIKYVETLPTSSSPVKILDLCTGSGAIAISLAKYIDNCKVTASDISSKALQIAKLNAERNLVHTKINFIESDMFENIDINNFDIIVSNPPYIESDVISTLSTEVQKEPHIALDGGDDGLKFYRLIVKNAKNYISENGKVFLEIGFDQKEKLFNLIEESKQFSNQTCIKDLSGNDRVIIFE
ncbi:MAG: peptide chain release factor N(5)-glutamine methyltransferase [Clostridia bacterium]|nr:peptide chain release factor N(5)-glutamine methyltransferase [Clostridia bacterium]MBR4261460.1 peptide chain release factor N(5)-glutamine methyltransferase [Clostridia bacterium]